MSTEKPQVLAWIKSWLADKDIPTAEEMQLILGDHRDRITANYDKESKSAEALKRFWGVMRIASTTPTRISPHQDKMEACRPQISDRAVAHAWVAAYTHPSNMHGLEVMVQMVDPSQLSEFFARLMTFSAANKNLEQEVAGDT